MQRNRKQQQFQNLVWDKTCFYLLLPSRKMVAIAQLVRASDCGSEGRGFEPHWLPGFKKPPDYLSGGFFILNHSSKTLVKQLLKARKAGFLRYF